MKSDQLVSAATLTVDPGVVKAVGIRCMWLANVNVVTAPSGTRYEFSPQQVRGVGTNEGNVLPEDVDHILSLQKPGGGCCGGHSEPFNYFAKENL